MLRYVWILISVGLFAVIGCEQKPEDLTPDKVTSEEVRRDANKAVETAVEYSRQAKDEFQKKLETQLNKLDAKIVALREKGGDLKDQAKENWDKKMADLETKREAARDKLNEVGRSSADAWEDVRKGAQSAWDEVDKAFRDASQEF